MINEGGRMEESVIIKWLTGVLASLFATFSAILAWIAHRSISITDRQETRIQDMEKTVMTRDEIQSELRVLREELRTDLNLIQSDTKHVRSTVDQLLGELRKYDAR